MVNPEQALPSVVLRGTVRTYSEEVMKLAEERMRAIVEGIPAANGGLGELDFRYGYPATINSEAESAVAADVAAGLMGRDNVVGDLLPSMGGEDFAFMLNEVPGAYLWLGAAREGENPGLHSAKFDFNDAVLPAGAEFWVRLARRATQG